MVNSSNRTVTLDHLVWDYQFVERREFKGTFDAESLAKGLVAEWVPYFECHKCGRSDYCKHVEWRKPELQLSRDIQCGVVVAAIENLVSYTFDVVVGSTEIEKQEWLDGAYHLAMFVHKAEIQIGNLIDTDVLDFWGEYVAGLFGQPTRIREHLDGIAHHFATFGQFKSTERVLFVEGWSEKAFIDRLKESRLIWFLYKHVEVYAGSGNRRPKRIQMLLDKYKERGYEIYFQGDSDGRRDDVVKPLVEKCGIPHERTFVFRYDFESAVPPKLLLRSLQAMGELEGVEPEEFRANIESSERPVSESLSEHYDLDLAPIKMDVAVAVADLLNATQARWSSNKSFVKTELGQFLRFVQRI